MKSIFSQMPSTSGSFDVFITEVKLLVFVANRINDLFIYHTSAKFHYIQGVCYVISCHCRTALALMMLDFAFSSDL